MEDLLHIVGKIRRDSSKDGKITGRYDTTRITVGRPAKVGDRVERGLVKEASQKPRLTRHDATTTELRCADGDTQCWVSAKRGILRQGQDLLSSDQRNYFPHVFWKTPEGISCDLLLFHKAQVCRVSRLWLSCKQLLSSETWISQLLQSYRRFRGCFSYQ